MLFQMYLDDQKRMKIDGSERPSSCRRANASNSKYDQVEAERERKRVYHGISRANRLALIVSSKVVTQNTTKNWQHFIILSN